ncbi:MAG: S41 family peptidase [Clostridia bacterium]|nr:S41 family peptidase [Clostridia bacterium]
MEKDKNRNFKVGMLIILTAFTTFLLTTLGIFVLFLNGHQVGKYVLVTKTEDNEQISNELDKIRTIIDKYFLGEVDEERLREGAIAGYIDGLNDPYTEYITKEEMKDYIEDTKGNFVGIGIYITNNVREDLIQVFSVISGSPAEAAGIQVGDLIKTIDGKEYTSDDYDIICSKIKGEEGSIVKIEVLRDNETLTFDVKREKVVLNKVEGEVLENNIGYIKLSSFDETTSKEFKEKFEELQSQNITSLIIDLRNNGGGIVNEALKIADFIADKGSTLLYEIDKDDHETVKKSDNDPIINMPIVILVNEKTASSSEIFAGALKDLGKAKIVGTNTYGKGVIQQILSLPDGSGLKITTEQYKTPSKNTIHKKGIEPDVKVEKEEEQLQKAIELLK